MYHLLKTKNLLNQMKTQHFQRLMMATMLSGLLFTACNKSNNSSSGTSNQDLQTQSDDETRVSTETDAAFDDVNTVMVGQASVTGASETPALRYGVAVNGGNQDTVKSSICDAVVTIDTVDNPRTITINYNGSNCLLTRVRTGSVVISIPKGTVWSQAGAHVTVSFNNLKIVRALDNKSIVLNGTHTYTNVSGGSLLSLNANSTSPIVHTVTSDNMSITFDNGSQRTWSVARQRSYSYSGGIVITETGLHASGNTTGISEWGTNRFGNSFQTQISQALVVAQSCSWQLTTGQVVVTNAAGSTTVTFGLNSTGGPQTSCPIGTAAATYYFELVWAGNGGKSYTFILPY
jgi:hypothetical protein